MLRHVSILIVCASCSACIFGGGDSLRCEDVTRYGYSRSIPPMRVPEGLDVPDERGALQIPPGEEYVVQDPETITECLETPPDFFEE